MKRLSENPDTIHTQISRSETNISHFEGELRNTPLEDPTGRQVIQLDLTAERKTLSRLKRHLDSLEDELLDMSDTTPTQPHMQGFDE